MVGHLWLLPPPARDHALSAARRSPRDGRPRCCAADFVCSIHYPRDDWRSSRDSPDDSKELRNKTKGPSRRFAGPTPLWCAAWCSRSATNEATPTVIWAIDIVSEAPSARSSFVSTPRGARSDRRLLPLEIMVAIFCGKLSSLSRISEDAGGREGRGSKHD